MTRAATRHPVARDALLLVAYTLFGLYALWPLPDHMFSGFADVTDPYASAWSLWWTQHQLLSLGNPWYSGDLYAPVGTYLGYHALVPAAGVALAPLTATVGAALTYNLAKLLIPVVSSYLAYRLLRRLGLDWKLAAVAGPFYGFATMLTWRAAYHLNFAVGMLLLPLVVLAALRLTRGWSARDAVLFGAALAASLYADQTSALLAALTAGTMLLGALVRDRARGRALAVPVTIAAVSALVLATPQLAMMLRQTGVDGAQQGADVFAPSWVMYDTSVASLLSPSPNLRLDGVEDVASRMYRFPFGEGIPAYGLGLLALALAGVALTWRRPAVRWLGLVWLAASVLALGPELTIGTKALTPLPVEHHGQRLSGLMPYTWLVELPGFANVRVSTRFAFVGLLAASLLAGFGLAGLWERRLVGRVVAGLLVTLVVLESGVAADKGFRLVPLKRSQLYEPVRRDKGSSIVVDVPLTFAGGNGGVGDPGPVEAMLRATEHGHPIAGGFVSRLAHQRTDRLTQHRFYTDVLAIQKGLGNNPGFRPPDPREGADDARRLNVGWVVVWPDASSDVPEYLRRAGFVPDRNVDGIRLYRRTS